MAVKERALEKRKPTYDLEGFRQEFATVQALRMTKTAQDTTMALGLTLSDVWAWFRA